MTIKQKTLKYFFMFLKVFIKFIAKDKAEFVFAELSEYIVPIVTQQTPIGDIRFFCPGKLPEWRATTLLTKEPETLEWIDGFADSDVFWDIGANVGVYSLYAGLRNIKVLSFEPSSANYYLLNKNIEINNMDSHIVAYCVALNDETALDYLRMLSSQLGGAFNSFGEAIDWKGEPYLASFSQGMLGYSLDDFNEKFRPLFPNHIKIDVDGIENTIIRGGCNVLKDKRLKSVLVELDTNQTEYTASVFDMMATAGFKLSKAEHAEYFNDSQYSSVFNHIFVRD
jgi:FkbM family methyltransferase